MGWEKGNGSTTAVHNAHKTKKLKRKIKSANAKQVLLPTADEWQ